ncbi:MAG: hypothetical protein CBC90_06920 [Acidimicrobiaceae bacterium TMED130]|nr:MAG: hypothetical protein CBC90_06920 [Acidimicrobiaceae bacterium TMED130]|tara:strand:- start:6222 stop:6482 length:261 start_codon:yes stop_codon:yes gene_type:complete
MDLLVVVDGVTDYDAWRKVFDEDEAERAKFAASMEAGPLDNDKVAIVAYGVDMEAMGAFMGTPEFAERTSSIQTGVTLYNLEALPQ